MSTTATPICELATPVMSVLLEHMGRSFGLLGGITATGLTKVCSSTGWVLTAEYGFLRIEQLSGNEKVLRSLLLTNDSFSAGEQCVTRSVFGLLPDEWALLLAVLNKGNLPRMDYGPQEEICALTKCIIPRGWPRLVVSNGAFGLGNISLEAFIRTLGASPSIWFLARKHPVLKRVVQVIIRMCLAHRKGLPYHREVVRLCLSS